MQKAIISLCLLCSLLMVAAPNAEAQFWKKIFKSEKKKQKSPDKPPKHEEKSTHFDKLKKRKLPVYPETEKKQSYRIDVLLPLYVNSLVADGKAIFKKPPAKMLPTINFYEGIKMAADSLNSLGYNLDIYIHDIESKEGNINHLITTQTLNQSDLIIGYLQSNELGQITSFAKKNEINFISALSPADSGVADNPYFILIQPALATHINQLVNFALQKNKHNPKYVFYLENSAVQKEAYQQLQMNLEDESYITIDCSKEIFNKDSLRTIFDPQKVNVIFINIFSTSVAESILKELVLLRPEFEFEIYGMPSWKVLSGLSSKKDYSDLNIYYTSPFYYDINSGPGKAVSNKYKKDYGGAPSELVFRGFESLMWMADLLSKYGTIFNNHITDVSATPFTRYRIQPKWSSKNDFLYLGNESLYIFHYKDGYFNIEK